MLYFPVFVVDPLQQLHMPELCGHELRYDRGTRLPGEWSTAGLKALQASGPH